MKGAYDRVFGRIPQDFTPALLRMVRLAPGMRALDIATDTGMVAEAIAAAVGRSGHVVGPKFRSSIWTRQSAARAIYRLSPSRLKMGRRSPCGVSRRW